MYPISKAFLQQLGPNGKNRKIEWYGSMVTESGTEYPINTNIIGQGTGSIKCACSLPFVGGAYSASLDVQLLLGNVDPRTLKNARIELFVRLVYPNPLTALTTWGDVLKFSWGDLLSTTWKRESRTIYTDIPMGVYYVIDAKRSYNSIKISANDSMVKFDADLPGMDSTSRSVYGWLKWACDACGVELGMTKEQIKAMPNGTRSFVYAVLESNVKTYRYLLEQMAAVLGAVAVIDRTGKLILRRLNPEPVAEITPDERFSSEYEDTQSRYTGLWLQYKAKAVQEYYKNVDALDDTGLVVDLGENPFLQISNDSARNTTLQNIADSFAGVTFNPFKASIPFHPEYDLLDVITFTGGHAPDDCHGPITSITWKINGAVSIECATPKEQVNPDRRNVQTSGTSGSRVSGGDFWIKVCSAPEEKLVFEDGQDYEVAKLTVNCTTDNTTMQIAWTGFYTLDEASRVTVRVLVDGKNIYDVSDDQAAGNHISNVTTGHSVASKGEYTVIIAVRAEVTE